MVFQWEKVRCDGNENKLSQCTHDVQHRCEVADKDVAGVKCEPSKIFLNLFLSWVVCECSNTFSNPDLFDGGSRTCTTAIYFIFFCDLTNRRVSSQHTVVPKLTIRILAPLSIVDYIPYNFITYVHVLYNEMCFQNIFMIDTKL